MTAYGSPIPVIPARRYWWETQTDLDIVLSSGELLEEVVVTGYTSQSKRDITGAVTTVDSEELLAIPATTFAQQLQGRASGITITNDATPGGGATVRIRGYGTTGNNEPLYIIDGVPTQNQGTLNPNDIETLQVLERCFGGLHLRFARGEWRSDYHY